MEVQDQRGADYQPHMSCNSGSKSDRNSDSSSSSNSSDNSAMSNNISNNSNSSGTINSQKAAKKKGSAKKGNMRGTTGNCSNPGMFAWRYFSIKYPDFSPRFTL